jgi:hypothetical protein
VVANNYYALSLNQNLVIGAGLNVYNEYSAEYFDFPVVTAETELYEKVKMPYMTLRHCPIKSHVGGDCKNCKYKDGYYYLTSDGKRLMLKRKKLSDCTFYLSE